jgi:tetratricopeptide (TPR) repeat protein
MAGEALARVISEGATAPSNLPINRPRLVSVNDLANAPATFESGAPQHVVKFHRGCMCSVAGQTEQAKQLYREAIVLEPNFSEAHCNLACELLNSDDLPGAVAAYRSATECQPSPKYDEPFFGLAYALLRNNQPGEAINPSYKAVQLNPNRLESYLNLAAAFCLIDSLDDGISVYSEAIRLWPESPQPYLYLGLALGLSGRLEPALNVFGVAAEKAEAAGQKEELALAYRSQGWLLDRMGRLADAATVYRMAITLLPDDPAAYFSLASTLWVDGQELAGATAFRRGLSLKPDFENREEILRAIDEFVQEQRNIYEDNERFVENIAESIDPLYSIGHMREPAIDLNAEAIQLGFTPEGALKILREASEAARENTGRAKADPRELSLSQVTAESALIRLRSRYDYLLAHTHLPEEIRSKKDAQLAGRLVETYRALRKHELAMGLRPTPKDDAVKTAHRLRVAFYRKHKPSQPRPRAGRVPRGSPPAARAA